MSVFGPIIHAGMVEDAVRDVLTDWVDTYLAEVERQTQGVTAGTVARPRDWVRTTDPLQVKTTQLPMVAIVSPGWASPPEWDADDDLGASATVWYAVSVIVYAKGRGGNGVNAQGRDEALNNARMLIAACREALLAKGELHPLIGQVVVQDEELGTHVHASRERTLTDAEAVFVVRIDEAMSHAPGPSDPVPPQTDPGDFTTAETIDVTQSNLNGEE